MQPHNSEDGDSRPPGIELEVLNIEGEKTEAHYHESVFSG